MKNKCRGREREHAPHITHEASAVSTGSAGEVVVGVGAAGRGVGFSGRAAVAAAALGVAVADVAAAAAAPGANVHLATWFLHALFCAT